MSEFDIYTIGSGYYLEKIFNAIRLIIDGEGGFISLMKFACVAAILVLSIKASINHDFKSASKWFMGVTVLVGLFLTSRATVHIHDKLPDSYGVTPTPRTVQNVPWGLAFVGSTTSYIGNFLAEKFDMAFAGTFVNSNYQKTGMLFGSKIVEDVAKLRIQDPTLKSFITQFYKKCVVKDLRIGHSRKNGYNIKDLAQADNLLDFFKEHSSKARTIYFEGKLDNQEDNYISCNKAAYYIADALNNEIEKRKPMLAKGFLSYFFPDQDTLDQNQLFDSILTNSYGLFLRKSSKEAKDILLQTVMMNAISDKADSYNKAFSKVATEQTTESAYYAISQMAQKFVPIYRAVLECILYGIFPLILVLMVTPIGLEVLKNYGFGFIYLQMWQPMYAILFCIASSWGKHYASNIDSLTISTNLRIANINGEISAIAGYMLASIPILSVFITRGMVSSMGNLASSVFYVQQMAAVQNAEQAIKGNYQIGTTSIDNHSFNTTNGNKYDDNYSWLSGMKSFSLQSGASEKIFSDERMSIDSSGAISNLAGLAKIDWHQAIGLRYDQSINQQMSNAERYSSTAIESASSGYSTMLGFDESFRQDSNSYQNWTNSLSVDQRAALDEARSYVNRFAENHGINQQDALKVAIAGNAGFGRNWLSGNIGIAATSSASKGESFNSLVESGIDSRFADTLSKVENIALSNAYQEGNSINNSVIRGARSDFHQAKSANTEALRAIDHVQSLQEARGNFQQSSNNIGQDLSNQFAEQGIKKYGTTGFEEIIRNQPEKTKQLLNEFLNDTIQPNQDTKKYSHYKNNFDNRLQTLQEGHKQNLDSVENSFNDNKAALNEISPKIENSEHLKDTINQKLDSKTTILDRKIYEQKNQTELLQEKAEEKNKQSAPSAHKLNPLNLFKDE